MKYCVIIPDGMADQPMKELSGRTPLEAARTPNMDHVARSGLCGMARTIPRGMEPGSDVAILSLLGYDPRKYYTGRAPLEATSLGIQLGEGHLAFRCNFVTVAQGEMADYSAGHIRTVEAEALIQFLNEQFGSDEIRFYPGVSYRHIMVYQGAAPIKAKCTPPHDIIGKPIQPHLPRGKGSALLNDLMAQSVKLLEEHDVNRVRLDHDENVANMIWLWGGGPAPSMPSFVEKYGKNAAVITAVDLVRGIARGIGMSQIDVPGATGYLDTDYAGKGQAAMDGLGEYDLVIVHVEAPDEASHEGKLREKILAIEHVDKEIVGPVLSALEDRGDHRLLVAPDHPTPLAEKTHVAKPVPFALCGAGLAGENAPLFNELSAAETGLKIGRGHELMSLLLGE